MRLGEALGLQWEDIDWHNRVIHVQRSYTSGRITTPKNGKTRRVDMSTQLTNILQDWQTRCEVDTLQRGWTEMPAWAFYTSTKRSFDDANLRNGTWRPCLANAGLRHIRIHDLRHTYASLLIQQGESLAYIRDQLGHHSISLTVDTYGHLVPGGNRQAVDRLDDAPECNPTATITL
jgi:integrase